MVRIHLIDTTPKVTDKRKPLRDPECYAKPKTRRGPRSRTRSQEQNAEIRNSCSAPPCIDRISSLMIVKKPSSENHALESKGIGTKTKNNVNQACF